MTSRVRHPLTREYWKLQLIFWGAYWALNLIFASSWGYTSWLTNLLFVLLSLLLMSITHAYRWIYVRHALDRSIGSIGLHLLWMLPLSALLIQTVVSSLAYLCLKFFSVAPQSVGAWSPTLFMMYLFNTAIILMLWCLMFLWRFETMRRRHAEREHWQNEIRLREAELQFLRSQINSHFLFNALNNIRSLILEDPHAARQGLSDLATMLRGILHSEAASTVSLREEVELVKGYLALEALQFEQRMSFDIAIDPRVQDARIPPLLLQTLVENAIKHGIARRACGGAVRVSAAPLGTGQWRLEVENPPAELPPRHDGNGIGLRNARERLKAAFGDGASLDLVIGDQVRATADLPL